MGGGGREQWQNRPRSGGPIGRRREGAPEPRWCQKGLGQSPGDPGVRVRAPTDQRGNMAAARTHTRTRSTHTHPRASVARIDSLPRATRPLEFSVYDGTPR